MLAVTLSAVATTPALADTVTSSNWAGYAVHRPGTTFTNVAAAWTQPKVRCTLGQPTYSAVWVGLGGYNMSSDALEQIGSEADCRASGKVDSTVWYELVPAVSQPIRMQVRPGDRMFATAATRAPGG